MTPNTAGLITDAWTLEQRGRLFRQVVQANFNTYPMLRMSESPRVEVYTVASDAAPGGIGEPGVPPIAVAVANAVFAATGKRLRKLPFRLEG